MPAATNSGGEAEAEKMERIMAANPVLRDPGFEGDVAKWNRLSVIAEKLFKDPHSSEAAAWIARGMEAKVEPCEGKEHG